MDFGRQGPILEHPRYFLCKWATFDAWGVASTVPAQPLHILQIVYGHPSAFRTTVGVLMSDTSLLRPHLYSLAVFPLPGSVFFPHTSLPLHVFEPRYLEMIETCIKDESPVAVARLKNQGAGPKLALPPLEDIAGVGFIKDYRRLEEGRLLVELYGAGKVRLEQEKPTDLPYRRFRCSLLEDHEEPQADAQVRLLRNLLLGLKEHGADLARVLAEEVNSGAPASVIADVCADLAFQEPDARQALLAMTSPTRRIEMIIHHLSDTWARFYADGGSGAERAKA